MAKYFGERWLMVGILCALLLWGCESKRLQVVARVGNDAITLQDLENEMLKGRPFHVVETFSLAQKREFLRKMIDNRLQLLVAKEQRLEQRPEIAIQLQDLRKRIAYRAAIDNGVVLKTINEAEIRDFYYHSRVKVRARHILLKLPPNPTDEELQEAMDKANDIVKQLLTGADFSEIAKQYSEDKMTAKRGGDLGYVQWGSRDPEFQRVVFALQKFQISRPVRTSAGIEIIQVVDRQVLPQRPYELAREDIIRTLSRKKQGQLREAYRNYIAELKKTNNVNFLQANIDTLWTWLSSAKSDSARRAGFLNPNRQFDTLSAKDRQMVLVQYKRGEIKVDDFIKLVQKMSRFGNPKPIRHRRQIEQILNSELEFELLAAEGMRRGWDRQRKYRVRYNQLRDQILLDEIHKREVDQKVTITDKQLRDYYQANRDSYKTPPQMEVQEILVTKRDVAERVYSLAKRGSNFDKLAEQYNESLVTKAQRGRLGFITPESHGQISRVASKMKVGEIRGPIKIGPNFSIIKVLSRKEPHYRPFEEVKAMVRRDLHQELVQKRQQEWLAELRSRVPTRIFEDVLHHNMATDPKTN